MKGRSQDEVPTAQDLSVKEMEARFKRILGKVGVQYNSIVVDGCEANWPIKINVDQQRNIGLSYNSDALRCLTLKEVEGLLYHEACHAVALPYNVTPCTKGGERMPHVADHFDCYQKYLADVEFMKRFRGTIIYDGLRSAHLRLLDNVDRIVWSLRERLIPDKRVLLGVDLFVKLETILSSIVYDFLFFFVSGDNMFLDRCVSLQVRGLHRFVGWVYEDFEYIRNLSLPLESAGDAVMLSCKLSCCVEPRRLMLRGDIEFYTHIIEFIQIEERKNVKWATDLAAAWRNRLT